MSKSDELRKRLILPRCAGVGFGLALWVCAALVAIAQTTAGQPDRVQWQRIPDLIAAMAIHAGDTVADVGAGEGFVTVRLSPLVGSTGKVFAVDVAEAPLEQLRKRVQEAAIANITIIKGDENDPHLPHSTLDSVIILNAYHEMASYQDILRHLHDAVKPGGRLVIAEPYPLVPGQSRAEQIAVHRISPELVAREVTEAGFIVISRQDDFTKIPIGGGGYSLIVARRP
jgi:predicted methyltransferase